MRSFAALTLVSSVWAESWSAYLGLGHRILVWDLVVIVPVCCWGCDTTYWGIEGSPVPSLEERSWEETEICWPEESDCEMRFSRINPIEQVLGKSMFIQSFSFGFESVCWSNLVFVEKSSSMKMTSREVIIRLSSGLKHKYPLMLSGYPIKMCAQVRLDVFTRLKSRLFEYAKHPKTLWSLRWFGENPKSFSNAEILTISTDEVLLYRKPVVAKEKCQKVSGSPAWFRRSRPQMSMCRWCHSKAPICWCVAGHDLRCWIPFSF